jgi:hypothetical protein
MNAFEAKFCKIFTGFNSTKKISATHKIAQLVNSDWIYSSYWPSEVNNKWIKDVEESIKKERIHAKNRLYQLEEAESILKQIDA